MHFLLQSISVFMTCVLKVSGKSSYLQNNTIQLQQLPVFNTHVLIILIIYW